jgi:hypothetical protein
MASVNRNHIGGYSVHHNHVTLLKIANLQVDDFRNQGPQILVRT